jgi:hypothetical protein
MSKRGAEVIVNWAALLVQSGAPVVQMCNLGLSRVKLPESKPESVQQEHTWGKSEPERFTVIALGLNVAFGTNHSLQGV